MVLNALLILFIIFDKFKCINVFSQLLRSCLIWRSDYSGLPLQRFSRTFEEFADRLPMVDLFSVLKQKYPSLQQETGVGYGI